MEKKELTEKISDWFLFVTITAPAALLFTLSIFCSGWNEGAAGSCIVPALTAVYSVAFDALFLFSLFGGILFVPLALVFMVISLVCKIQRYRRVGFPQSTRARAFELVTWAPIVLLIFLVYVISSSLGLRGR